MAIGKTMLGRRHVLPSVVSTLTELMVEGTFVNGTYLVTIHHPISSDDGDLEKALYSSFLPIPSKDAFPLPDPSEYETEKAPGAVIPVKEGKIVLNEGRKRIKLKITSKGDRPIQVLTQLLGWAFAQFAFRSDRITISLRRIHNLTSIGSRRMAIDSTLPPEHRFASSQVIPRLSLALRLPATARSMEATTLLPAESMCHERMRS
jgi:hypothetical protein